jgi:hypothetical protein
MKFFAEVSLKFQVIKVNNSEEQSQRKVTQNVDPKRRGRPGFKEMDLIILYTDGREIYRR